MSTLLFQQLCALIDIYGADKVIYTLNLVIDTGIENELAKAKAIPYPFCRHPDKCAGKGYCQHDPACNE
jgi:hypothetical protein